MSSRGFEETNERLPLDSRHDAPLEEYGARREAHTVELEGGPCHADVYDLDPTRMGHDEVEKAQHVLRLAVALRRLFPDSYSKEEERVDEAFRAIR